MKLNRRAILVVAAGASVVVAGCAGVGPPTVPRDRFDYVQAISDSWKRQMLQNLLKIRYADAPVFLDVTSVINAYSLDANASAGGQVAHVGRGDMFATIGAGVAYGDKPTITYSPLSGDKFARSLMTPIPISGILFLLQSGYPADAILRICVNSINGLDNARGDRGDQHPGDPEFAELLSALREAQLAGMLDFRQKTPKDRESAVMALRPSKSGGTGAMTKIRELLGLDPKAREFNVVYGAFPADKTDVAILSRSTLQVMAEFGSYIEVPAADIAEGRVYAPSRNPDALRRFPPLLRIQSGAAAPTDAYVALRYRDTWFWIDDRDVRSKTMLSTLMLLFSLTETGATQAGAPVVTVPAR